MIVNLDSVPCMTCIEFLEAAGVEFIAENGKGPGVRLCKPESPTRG